MREYLFCHVCGHQFFQGEVIRKVTPNGESYYVCPKCEHRVRLPLIADARPNRIERIITTNIITKVESLITFLTSQKQEWIELQQKGLLHENAQNNVADKLEKMAPQLTELLQWFIARP